MLKAIWFVPPALATLAAQAAAAKGQTPLVQGVATSSSDEQFEALRDGRQDLAITAMDNVIMWNRRAGPADFRIVAQLETTTGLKLVARPGLTRVSALAGGKLLVDSAVNGFVVALRTMLADAGIAADGYTLVEAGGVRERFERLIGGEGNATLLGPPFIGLANEQGFNALVEADRAYPGFPGQGVVVRAGRLAQLHDPLVEWLTALEAARSRAKQDPAQAARTLADAGLAHQVAAAMVVALGGTLEPSPVGIRILTEQRRALGLPGEDDTYDKLVDLSLLNAIGARAVVI
ncbi:ABC-type nitrate/sulfonate/bicarbonate transport system substrate-binding protein [Novosphingobium chloroacetimidivorans]|uniref:ABC-type nitrate/sulfonate/bicarbonate transport system substrate-binding protein n=1 Tax=Novosphingobium chloroacetimidivorans TaxID=1428314 RepID=A0A7W7NWZ3_9SPHN|nr:ABC transporter substrate-binding protein [Novosphingobium chloroacetimidivorans]MBB4858650.1 ABC-type nitrate/sulfonate/bicarbonate transport system substrate-binding protein [Novosphingobium chloroacetimidivorans]